MSLKKYFEKRNFKKTPEPHGSLVKSGKKLSFVIQKHHASRLHYDFRLELGGTLKSWAIPKGPSLDPDEKRLAVQTEDHPVQYATFEGEIPKGEYGGGHMIVWDNGTWTPPENPEAALRKGRLDFSMHGQKIRGKFSLIRLRDSAKGKDNWLLFKRHDEEARPGSNITEEQPDSVLTKKRSAKKREINKSSVKVLSSKKKAQKKKRSSVLAPPGFIEPQLAQLVKTAPDGGDWIHEIKFDGYRTLCRKVGESVRLLTRSGLDWTDKYGPIGDDILKLDAQNAILDGEIVWVDENGYTHFQGLQTALQERKFARLVYYVFDLLFLDGEDLRERPLRERKDLLEDLLKRSECKKILYSEHFEDSGRELLSKMCSLNLEGIVSKLATHPYTSGRSGVWQKAKCSLRQEFVIGGFADSDVEGRVFSSLLMGVYNKKGQLQYIGRVGTGYNEKTLASLGKELQKRERDESPFQINSPRERDIHWVKPDLVGEVEFKTWTGEGVMRHASFQGLRKDKKASSVVLEIPKSNTEALKDQEFIMPAKKTQKTATARKQSSPKAIKIKPRVAMKTGSKAKPGDAVVQDIRISHPERVIYPKTKTTKLDVVKYYDAVADKMLPFLADRPLSIVRCQDTSTNNCFFQKHVSGSRIIGVGSKPVQYKEKKGSALIAESKDELIHLVQGGALEVHAWGSQFSKIHNPDVMIFDLDPESVSMWPAVVETAHQIRDMLKRLGLQSFCKVTGGKGVHVQVPIQPRYDWEVIKGFTKSLMQVLVNEAPDKYTVNMIKTNRKGRIFLDYLRNGYGATAVLPYVLRAREKPTVALPISWKELTPKLSASEFEFDEVMKIIKKRKDPWAGYWDLEQKIAVLEKKSTAQQYVGA